MMKVIDFGPLAPFIEDDSITDINYNGSGLWIDHLKKGRYHVEFEEDEFMQQLFYKIANYVNQSFNTSSPLVEAETKELRISLLHDSIARSGHSLSIRKTPAVLRIDEKNAVKSELMSKEILEFLIAAIKGHCNILVNGLPGSGKTELIKFLSSYIADKERIITIEDTLELRIHDIFKEKDCVAMKVNDGFSYAQAIKASLRQRPDWILVSEVRSHEVVHLLESISTGTHLLSTIHTNNAFKIPQRILHMFPNVEIYNEVLLNSIYEAIDLGIHVESEITSKGITRKITQIVAFDSVDHQPNSTLLFDIHQKIDLYSALNDRLKEKCQIKAPTRRKRTK